MSSSIKVPKVGTVLDGWKCIKRGIRRLLWKELDRENYSLEDYEGEQIYKSSKYKNALDRFEADEAVPTDNNIVFSEYGNQIIDEVKSLFPRPVLFIGDSGWGKSILVRSIAESLGLGYSSVNAHPGMRMNNLVGMWRPYRYKGGGTGIKWQDGLLTSRIRGGGAFLMEEITRSPQEMVSRLYGVLDSSFRYWSMPEAGLEVDVSDQFWFLATANPVTQGYYTQRLDKALLRRFTAVYEVNQPVADESGIAISLVGHEIADRVLKFVSDVRSNSNANLATGELVNLLRLVKQGFSLVRAVEIGLANKLPETLKAGVIETAKLHESMDLSSEDDVEIIGKAIEGIESDEELTDLVTRSFDRAKVS